MKKLSAIKSRSQLRVIKPFFDAVTDDPAFCPGTTLLIIDTRNIQQILSTNTGKNMTSIW